MTTPLERLTTAAAVLRRVADESAENIGARQADLDAHAIVAETVVALVAKTCPLDEKPSEDHP